VFRHVVLFTFKPETTSETKAAIVDALRTLPAAIPELRDYRVGLDAGVNEGNYEMAVTADCADVDGYLAYRDNAEHQRIIVELIRPNIAERAAVQYEL
jgi:hypothetical protein